MPDDKLHTVAIAWPVGSIDPSAAERAEVLLYNGDDSGEEIQTSQGQDVTAENPIDALRKVLRRLQSEGVDIRLAARAKSFDASMNSTGWIEDELLADLVGEILDDGGPEGP